MIGDRIRMKREAKGMEAKHLAQMIGITPSYLSLLETNKRNNPTPELLEKIARALDTTVDFLLGNYDWKLLGELIRIIRDGRTDEQFATDTGMDIDYLTGLEMEVEADPPSPEELKRIADSYPSELLVDYIDLLEAAGHINKRQAMELRHDTAKKFDEKYDTEKLQVQVKNAEIESRLTTFAANRTDGYDDDLPPEALEELEQYKEFLRMKYKKKRM
jgi:transcriptional regulator with XRE-family HTH domain